MYEPLTKEAVASATEALKKAAQKSPQLKGAAATLPELFAAVQERDLGAVNELLPAAKMNLAAGDWFSVDAQGGARRTTESLVVEADTLIRETC